ncbi:MAG: hypothetical protein KFF77_04105 [Bacteroidetes bacterium]|nr:hypothetical protein [Bacteroidota bacterium]
MLTLYLACLVFGGVLLAISLFTGGDADSDMDHSLEAHGDLDAHPDFDAHAELDAHGDFGGETDAGVDMDAETPTEFAAEQAIEVHADTAGHLPTESSLDSEHPAILSVHDVQPAGEAPSVHGAAEYLSFRNFIYTTTFFGLTGSALTWLGTPFGVTLGSSIGMGLFAGFVGHRFMRYLRTSESGEGMHVSALLGHPATVVLPPTKVYKGKVRVTIAGQRVLMLALLHADADDEAPVLRPGDRVFVVAIDRDVAHVDRGDFLDDAGGNMNESNS